jgi:hypothetical protein
MLRNYKRKKFMASLGRIWQMQRRQFGIEKMGFRRAADHFVVSIVLLSISEERRGTSLQYPKRAK